MLAVRGHRAAPARRGRLVGGLAQDVTASGAAGAPDPNVHDRRPPTQWDRRQFAQDGGAGDTLTTELMIPNVGFERPAARHRMIVMDLLSGHRPTELIQSAEAVEIRGVEVLQMAGVSTIGSPRPFTQQRRAPTAAPSSARSQLRGGGIRLATVAGLQPRDVVGCGSGGVVFGLVAGVVVQACDVEDDSRAVFALWEVEVKVWF
jgi:hypothetical protein